MSTKVRCVRAQRFGRTPVVGRALLSELTQQASRHAHSAFTQQASSSAMAWRTSHHQPQLNNNLKTAHSLSQMQHRHPHMIPIVKGGLHSRAWTSRQAAQHNNIMTALCSGKQLMWSAFKQVRGWFGSSQPSSAASAALQASTNSGCPKTAVGVLSLRVQRACRLLAHQTQPVQRQQQQMSPGGSSSLHNACRRHQTPCWQQLETGDGRSCLPVSRDAGLFWSSNASRKLQHVDRAAGLLEQVRNGVVCFRVVLCWSVSSSVGWTVSTSQLVCQLSVLTSSLPMLHCCRCNHAAAS